MSVLIEISDITIDTDEHGRFNLNALHNASGTGREKEPNRWLRLKSTDELIDAVKPCARSGAWPINVVRGGQSGGIFAHEVLAVSYAGWISPQFQVQVNQVFLAHRRGEYHFSDPKLQAIQQSLIEIDKLDHRVTSIEQKMKFLDSDTGYRTITGFCREKEISLSISQANWLGRLASKAARNHGITIGKVPDERFGAVNSYPIQLIEEVYGEAYSNDA